MKLLQVVNIPYNEGWALIAGAKKGSNALDIVILLIAILLTVMVIRKLYPNPSENDASEVFSKTDYLRSRAVVSKSPAQGKTDFSSFQGLTNNEMELQLPMRRSAEIRTVEAIPGETLEMLVTRLQNSLFYGGVSVGRKDVGKILGAYACTGGARINSDAVEEMDPTILRRVTRTLSEFFCLSMPGTSNIVPEFLPADASVPKYNRVKIEMKRLEQADRSSGGGIGGETFRGILREAEEELYIPEEKWRQIDILLDEHTGKWFAPARHLMVRNIENLSTCLLASGATQDEALDYALHQALLLRLQNRISRSELLDLGEAFDALFRESDMPLCRNFLTAYSPVPKNEETSAAKNPTIHGGEYESE